VYPEYWYSYSWLSDYYERQNDSAKALALWQQVTDTLTSFVKSNESNLMWREDLGLSKVELGRRKHDQGLIDAGIMDLKEAFNANQNSSFGFRKYASVLIAEKRYGDLTDAAKHFVEYKINYGDPLAQQILNIRGVPGGMGEEQ
jgi:tetratricopeptide (TPR) repeat protein